MASSTPGRFLPHGISPGLVSRRLPLRMASAKFACRDLCMVVGEDAEILLRVAEDSLVLRAEPRSSAVFSPFPTKYHFRKVTLGRSDKSVCCAFHNFTALITTTSFMVVKNNRTAVVVMRGRSVVEKRPWPPGPRLAVKEFRFPCISHKFTCFVGFILCEKASTVRQR